MKPTPSSATTSPKRFRESVDGEHHTDRNGTRDRACHDERVTGVLSAIPYTTFPLIEIGPLQLRTFGLVVAIGVLVGAWLAARYGEGYGVPRDTTYSLAMRMVVAGVIGSRITWVAVALGARSTRRSTSSRCGRAGCSSPAASCSR